MSALASAAALLDKQKEKLRRSARKMRIVFPEGDDARIQAACNRLSQEELITPVPLRTGVDDRYWQLLYERRRSRGMTELEARKVAATPLYFGALMVAAGDADGLVGGAANTTADTIRAALHCIGPAKDTNLVSSAMLMCLPQTTLGGHDVLAFADCAIIADPTSCELASIAIATAVTVRQLLRIEPKMALLSFSTKGSAEHASVEKVREALRVLRERAPDLNADGEMQADAALVPTIGSDKAKGSSVAGYANTLIFPDLASGNIAYKLVERLAGSAAFGPLLQGLAKPVNDLSRGCSADDVYAVAILTAISEVR